MKYNIVVAGGGFAGLYSALCINNILNKSSLNSIEGRGFNIFVIRSKSIGTVGVGESVTQTLMPRLLEFGVNPKIFFKESKATLKLSAQFTNWHKPNNSFHHPLVGSRDLFHIDPKFNDWLANDNYQYPLVNNIEAESSSLVDSLIEENLVPFNQDMNPIPMQEWYRMHPIDSYGINFDASAVIEYLESFIESTKPNIKLIEGNIVDWKLHPDTGFVESLILDNHQKIEGNFYIDCTGFKRLFGNSVYNLKWKHIDRIPQNTVSLIKDGVKWKSSDKIPLYSTLTAMPEGWMFAIPLQHRMGSGYIHSSDISDIDDIRQQHINYWLNKGYKNLELGPVLKWSPGYFETPLYKNVAMIGLAQGFIDALDSNSLILTSNALDLFLKLWNPLNGFNDYMYKLYNEERIDSYEWTIDTISYMHQVSNNELKSEYWKYHANAFPKRFKDVYNYMKCVPITKNTVPLGAPFGLSTLMLFAEKYNLVDMNYVNQDYKLKSQLSNQLGKEYYNLLEIFNNGLKNDNLIDHTTWLNKFIK